MWPTYKNYTTAAAPADNTCYQVVTTSAPTCYALTLGHTGQGTTPTASPTNSTGCSAGQYVAGEAITLSGAVPDTGWQIESWTGTSNDSSTANTNSLSMPASGHSATVVYGETSNEEIVSFQEGVGGYAGTQDTYILQNDPDTSYGDELSVEWDTEDTQGNVNTQKFGLIRFDNIFGSGAGQIQVGSTIVSANLEYTVFNSSATGDANVNAVLVDWTESVTYNSFGATAGVQLEDYGTLVTTAPASAITSYTINVTSSLTDWSTNPSSNRGWIFRPAGNDGVDIRSSEYATPCRTAQTDRRVLHRQFSRDLLCTGNRSHRAGQRPSRQPG